MAVMLIPASLHADEWGIAVIQTDGSVQQVKFTDIERIDIASQTLTLHTLQGKESEYAYSTLNRIDIGVPMQTVSIENITANGAIAVWPTLTKESINISGAPAGTRIMVYNPGGQVVATAVANGNMQTINLSASPAGLYIVSVGKHSTKIVKR